MIGGPGNDVILGGQRPTVSTAATGTTSCTARRAATTSMGVPGTTSSTAATSGTRCWAAMGDLLNGGIDVDDADGGPGHDICLDEDTAVNCEERSASHAAKHSGA